MKTPVLSWTPTATTNLERIENVKQIVSNNILELEFDLQELFKLLTENKFNTKYIHELQATFEKLKIEIETEMKKNENI